MLGSRDERSDYEMTVKMGFCEPGNVGNLEFMRQDSNLSLTPDNDLSNKSPGGHCVI